MTSNISEVRIMAKTTVKGTKKPTAIDKKIGTLKTGILYVLIGGLVVAALISIVAILIGEFNEVIRKALGTTLLVMSHCLLILLIVMADRNNLIGRSLILTTVLGTIFANIFTSIFGIWDIWEDSMSEHFLAFYVLLIGMAFVVTGIRKLWLKTKAVSITTTVSIAAAGLFTVVVTPWIFADNPELLDDFYYRLVGATTVLLATSFTLLAILNRIAVSRNPKLVTKRTTAPLNAGLIVLFTLLGIIIAFCWLTGLFNMVYDASAKNRTVPCVAMYSEHSPYGYERDCRY